MEDPDRTVASKKAYAEVLLNITKESANRVMLSERKAVRFQQDLSSSKDEAYCLLVRLKQMIDAKTIETEITSSNQQRRIDELEAQLQEAEDIITDLRSDVRWLSERLEKAKREKLQLLNVKNVTGDGFPCQEANCELISNFAPDGGIVDGSISDTRDGCLIRISLDNNCQNRVGQSEILSVPDTGNCNSHESNPDNKMSNKDPELHINGLPESVGVLEGKLSPGGTDDGCSLGKSEVEGLTSAKIDEDETSVQDKRRCIVIALKAKNVELGKTCSGEGMKKALRGNAFRRRRKRRYGKAKAISRRSHIGQLLKPCPSTSVPFGSKTSVLNGNDDSSHSQPPENVEKTNMVKESNGLEEYLIKKSCLYSDEIAILRKRNRNIRSLGSVPSLLRQPDQVDKPCQKLSNSPNNMNQSDLVSSGEEKLEVSDNGTKIKPLSRLDPGLTLIRSNVDPISGAANVAVSVKTSRPVVDIKGEIKVAIENTAVSSSEMKPETVDVPLEKSNSSQIAGSEDTIISQSKADTSRLVKYTFHRKRKKVCLSDNDENASPVKRKVDDKQNESPETQESKLVNEPSRGTRPLVQVAHQVIILQPL